MNKLLLSVSMYFFLAQGKRVLFYRIARIDMMDTGWYPLRFSFFRAYRML
jgi:hypothetical protein